jgi:hypothetical protein
MANFRMKAGAQFLFLSLGIAAMATSGPEPTPVARSSSPTSAVHREILGLLQQDVAKKPATPKEAPAPFLNPEVVADGQPVMEGILELEPFRVTQKKAIELPLRVNSVTLDNFFYGDGAIYKNKDGSFVISVGREGLKLTKKF